MGPQVCDDKIRRFFLVKFKQGLEHLIFCFFIQAVA